MRGAPVAAVLALVALAHLALAYESDKLYKYDFEGVVNTKIADDEKPQYAGYAIRSPLTIERSGSNELTLALGETKYATYNGLFGDLEQLSKSLEYKPIEKANALSKPFKIYLDGANGAVQAMDVYKSDDKWMTNFKRGLLGFVQLKIKDAPSSPDAANDQIKYFTTNEKSVFGECATQYVVTPESSNSLHVSKTRNWDKCKQRHVYRSLPIDSVECPAADKHDYKYSSSVFDFKLNKTSDANYYVRKARLDETSTYSPWTQKAHSHQIKTHFFLNLVDIENGKAGKQPEDGAERSDVLAYDAPETNDFYAFSDLTTAHHLAHVHQTSASVEQAFTVFEELEKEHKQYTQAFGGELSFDYQENSRMPQLFMRLNEMVGTMDTNKIEQLYSKVDESGETHKKIFWDVMSVVGTNPSFMFMKKLITDGDAPAVKIKDFLTRLSFHIKTPSKNLFNEYNNLCKSDKVQGNQQYKRLCSLPLASLVHQHCVKPNARELRAHDDSSSKAPHGHDDDASDKKKCQVATAEEFFDKLVPAMNINDADLSTGDKMFNIKMAGELGVKPSIAYLMQVVRARSQHPSLRAAAMWQLSKVSRMYPQTIKRQVVPFFLDREELLDVRIAAFYNWFFAGMSLEELETLAEQLQSEPNRQLVLYIHSFMKSMAETPDNQVSCMRPINKLVRQIMPAIKRAARSHGYAAMSDSHVAFSSTWNPDYGYGTYSFRSVIFSNESYAPINLHYASAETMAGIKVTPMTVNVQAHGLDKLIKRVIGINGLLADKESFMDVFSLKRRNKRQVGADSVKQEVKSIEKELNLETREFSDVYIAATLTVYGRPITFVDRDSKELKKMLSDDGTIKVPHIKKLLHSFNDHTTQQMMINVEKLEVFNNELGLPLFQSIQDFNYKTFKLNSIKLDVEPGFFRDERQGKPPTRLTAQVDAKSGNHNFMVVATGATLPNSKQQVGVGFIKKKLVNIPTKMSLDANLQENKITIKRAPIHDNLVYIKQGPASFVRSFDPEVQAKGEPNAKLMDWKPLYQFNNTAQMKPFKLEYMTPLALGLKAEGKHRTGQDWSMAAWRRWISSVGLQAAKFMYTYSPSGAPLEVRVSTATTDENPTKDMQYVLEWKHSHADSKQESTQAEKDLEALTGGADQEGKPTTVNYKLTLIGGSAKERKLGIDIGYSRSFDKLLHKWRVFYHRTPLDQNAPNSEVTNLCWLGDIKYPRYDVRKLLAFDVLAEGHATNLTSELTFGDDCSESKVQEAPSRVSVQMKLDWSKEQREQIEAALSKQQDGDNAIESEKRNSYAQMYKRCMARRAQSNAQLDGSCMHLLYRMGELTHADAQIEYKDVPQRWTKLVKRLGSLYTYARAGYIDEMDDKPEHGDYKSSDGSRDRAHLHANISTSGMHDRKLSYEFDTPNYHVSYKGLPFSMPPLSTFPLLDSSYYQLLQSRVRNRMCSVSGNSVQTFDNLTYTLPDIADGCFKLITKDCSPENNFLVLGAKVGAGKSVKVYVAQKFKVEFVPDNGGKQVSEIKINGDKVEVPANKAPLSRQTKQGQVEKEAFNISNNGAFYTLASKLYKFSVSTDGTWILVQQSKYYAGKSCGICGDANGDQILELKSPSSMKRGCESVNDFVWAHVLPSTCPSRPADIKCA